MLFLLVFSTEGKSESYPIHFLSRLYTRALDYSSALFILVFHAFPMSVQDLSVNGDRHNLPGDHFTAVLQCFLCRHFQTAAAWHFHAEHRYGADIILLQNLRQFLTVIDTIQLRTADQRHSACHKFTMEPGICISCTICCNKQLCAFKIRTLQVPA